MSGRHQAVRLQSEEAAIRGARPTVTIVALRRARTSDLRTPFLLKGYLHEKRHVLRNIIQTLTA